MNNMHINYVKTNGILLYMNLFEFKVGWREVNCFQCSF